MANLDRHYEVDQRFRAFEVHREGTLVSLAGPGTGKTFSILRRNAALLNIQRICADSICYVTFIKEIAKAFQSDFDDEFQADEELLRTSTLHSLACRLIRNRGFTIGYDDELYFTSIAPKPDTFESRVFLTDLIYHLDHPNLYTIARLRNSLIRVKEA